MAIFVALIFQVLFVLFAMAINIGLVVHDKINLQNAVDIAAYYAAQRQAEILNAIADQNYQIRQAWKLLSWRYRVLGSMGFLDHPIRQGFNHQDVLYPGALGPGGQAGPAVCVTNFDVWESGTPNDNFCKKQLTRIPAPPIIPNIAPFNPLNAIISQFSQNVFTNFSASCSNFGAYNWWFGMNILTSFRMEQFNRKQVIYALADNLSGNESHDFTDINGQSVYAGARKTFVKNLTHENYGDEGSNIVDFQIYNSLKDVQPEQWLSEIKVIATLLYMDVADGSACNAVDPPPMLKDLPRRAAAISALNGFPHANALKQFRDLASEPSGLMRLSVGVEKNPWYMAYMGVKAKTKPRQVFFPLGDPVVFEASSFAKPFGGRIGPWYSGTWSQQSLISEGQKVDPHLPPRIRAGGMLNSQLDRTLYPNYSRYPGDGLGLNSKMAQTALTGITNQSNFRLNYSYFHEAPLEMRPNGPNDGLIWNFDTNSAPNARNYELAALAPDLFDITYYSVFPNAAQNMWIKIRQNKDALKIPSNVVVRPAMGYRRGAIDSFSVQDQMASVSNGNGVSLHNPNAFYFIRKKEHLLTGWVHPLDIPKEYTLPADRFGKCQKSDDDYGVKALGSCVVGGRVGYSVKLTSKDALFSSEFKIGGGSTQGSILNPPSEF